MEFETIVAIILWVVMALMVGFIIYSVSFGFAPKENCEKYCKSYGTIFSETIKTGSWGNDDLCICYFEDSTIKTWRMPK